MASRVKFPYWLLPRIVEVSSIKIGKVSEEMINNYGADAVRFFILSDSPPEKDVQWSEQGMVSSYKFVQKFWSLHKIIIELEIDKTKDKSIIGPFKILRVGSQP